MVAAWLPGTELQEAMVVLMAAEEMARQAQQRVAAAKRDVAAAMHGMA